MFPAPAPERGLDVGAARRGRRVRRRWPREEVDRSIPCHESPLIRMGPRRTNVAVAGFRRALLDLLFMPSFRRPGGRDRHRPALAAGSAYPPTCTMTPMAQ